MKKILIIPFLILFCNAAFSQINPTIKCGIYFDYDAAGNRIKRYYDCKDPTSAPSDPNPGGPIAFGKQAPPTPPGQTGNADIMTDKNVMVFPNPVTDKFSIKLSKPADHTHFHIYDAKGAIITSGNIEGDRYDGSMGNLPAGNYMVSVYFDNKTYSFTITRL